MTDKEKKVNNSNPQEDVSRFSDDDSMSIQDADISDSEHDLLIRLSQQAQNRRASQNQYHNDINVIGDDSHNDTTASLDLEVVSNEHDIEDHLDDEIIEEDDDDDDNSDNDDNSHDHSDDFEDPDSMSMMETADFLRQLMQARRNRTTEIRNSNSDSAGQSLNEDDDEMDNDEHDNINDDDDNDGDGNEDDEEVEEEEDEDEDDPRAEFLRAIGALTGGNRNSSNGDTSSSGNGFVDVMQRLMGGGVIFDGGSARDSGEIDALVNNLSQREDTYIVLESMNELSERLLMMNGLTAERLIPANKLARSLIEIMEDPKLEEELELHLVACRCLYNFLEVNQDFIHDALNNNAIPALCNKLLEIKYIDLTEQALQTLEMISRDPISHNSIISNNGLTACLQYLDFLTIHAQRKCLTIVANSCSNISIGNFPKVKEAFNGIAEVVRNHNDKVVVENAWLTISRIVMCFKNKPDLLNELFADKELLFKELTKVILVSCNKSSNTSSESNQVTLNHGSNLSLIKSLIILVSVSVDVSRILISECEIGSIIVKSLNKYAKQNQEIDPLKTHSDSISIEALMSAPKDLISQFLSLIGYLLPITYSTSDALYLRPNYEQDQERQNINQTRIELCTQLIPNEYWKFVNDIWSLLILSFQATMDFEIRRKGFVNLYRIICSNESDFSLIKDVDFIAGLLANVVTQYQSIVIKEFASVESNDDDMVSTDVEENEELGQASTSQEDEDDYDDEDEDDEVVDEDEDEEFSILDSRGTSSIQSSTSSLPEDVNKLNSLMLLLSSLKIIKVLLEKAPFTIIGLFEKEGLINDVLRLLKTLSDKADLNEKDPRASINSMMSAYSNKFIDSEFTKEYEYKLTSRVIYSNIVSIATDINSLYQQSKNEGLQNISENMKVLQEVKLDTSYLPIMPDSEPLEPLNQESSSNTEQLKLSTTPNIPARPQTRPQKQSTTTTTTVPTDQDSTTETSLEKPLDNPQDELDELAHEIEKVLSDPVIPPRPQHGSSTKSSETQTEHKEHDFEPAHPAIPQRPTNKKETIQSEVGDHNNGLESKSDLKVNKETSDDSVSTDKDKVHIKPSIPTIPSRPQSRNLDFSEVDNTKPSTTPSIPARPQRQSTTTQDEYKPQASNTPDIVTRPQTKTEKSVSNEELDKPGDEPSSKDQDNERHTDDSNASKSILETEKAVAQEEKKAKKSDVDNKPSEPTTSTDSSTEPTAPARGFRLPLHMQQGSGPISTSTPVAGSEAELNSLNNSNTFGDGEVTPGNSDTKATFKNDEDVENENRTDSSSFDDDMETISQDNEDGEQDRRNRQETATEENAQESEAPQFETTIIESGETEERDGDDTDSGELYSEQQQNKEKEKIVPATSTPKIPQRPPKKSSLSRATTNDSLTSLDSTSKPPKPVIPKRPTTEESLSNIEPTIPSRPATKKITSVGESQHEPIVPNRPDNKDLESSQRDTQASVKSKPPPPKPKKLSSKIAAFQQQLFNPANASSEEDVSSTGSKQPESGIRKRSTENSVLSRFGGKAIPLPGMFNPNQMPKPSISHGEETSDDREEKQESATANAPVRRTRGPRGKKLPKAVADAEVKTESRFAIESGKLWSIEFKKKIVEEKEITSTSVEDLEKPKILSENDEAGDEGKETAVENEVIDNPEIPVKDELQHDVVDVVGHPEKDVVTGLDDDDEDVPPEVNERFIKDEEISNVGVERTIASETTTEKHSTDEEEVEEEAVVDSVDIPIRRVAVNIVDSTEVQKDVEDEP